MEDPFTDLYQRVAGKKLSVEWPAPPALQKNLVLRQVPFLSNTNRGKNMPSALSGLRSGADSFVAKAHVTNKFTEFKGAEEAVLVSPSPQWSILLLHTWRCLKIEALQVPPLF